VRGERVDERTTQLPHRIDCRERPEQEDGIDAIEVRREPDGVGEVAGNELDAVGHARVVRVADGRTHRLIGGDELLGDLPANGAGGSGDEDHPFDLPLTSRSDLPTTSRASIRRCASAASSSG